MITYITVCASWPTGIKNLLQCHHNLITKKCGRDPAISSYQGSGGREHHGGGRGGALCREYESRPPMRRSSAAAVLLKGGPLLARGAAPPTIQKFENGSTVFSWDDGRRRKMQPMETKSLRTRTVGAL